MIYALDTNIISYIVNGNPALLEKLETELRAGSKVIIPLMVYYEVRRGLNAKNAVNKSIIFEGLCKRLKVHNLTVIDMDNAASIYVINKNKGRPMDDVDLLVAAQCVTNGYILVTHNTRHFNNVNNLKTVDWVE